MTFHRACCCQAVRVGFDESSWDLASCFKSVETTTFISSSISTIHDEKVVFAGNNSGCGSGVRFNEEDWPEVRIFIENGGRLFLALEYEGCLNDPDESNAFMSSLGSSISWSGGIYDTQCIGHIATPGSANIAQGLSVEYAATAEITGGTSLLHTKSDGDGPVQMAAVEQLGAGFLFVVGDSNLWTCSDRSCELAKRVVTYPDEDII